MPNKTKVLINHSEIKNDQQFNRARKRISQELARMKLNDDNNSLTSNDFHKSSLWMNEELKIMQNYLDLMENTMNVPQRYEDAIKSLRDQADKLGSKFPVASAEIKPRHVKNQRSNRKQIFLSTMTAGPSDTTPMPNTNPVKINQQMSNKARQDSALEKFIRIKIIELVTALEDVLEIPVKNNQPMEAVIKTAGLIRTHLGSFEQSNQDKSDFDALKVSCEAAIKSCETKLDKMKDPMLTRVFHALVNAVKTLLSYLDYVQSLFTGQKANERNPARTHWITSPVSPVSEAKSRLGKFDNALKTMHSEVMSASEETMNPKHQ